MYEPKVASPASSRGRSAHAAHRPRRFTRSSSRRGQLVTRAIVTNRRCGSGPAVPTGRADRARGTGTALRPSCRGARRRRDPSPATRRPRRRRRAARPSSRSRTGTESSAPRSVAITPGWTLKHRMPSSPVLRSEEPGEAVRCRLRSRHSPCPSRPRRRASSGSAYATAEVMFTIVPPPRSTMAGSDRPVQHQGPDARSPPPAARAARSACRGTGPCGRARRSGALCTTTSIASQRCRTVSTARSSDVEVEEVGGHDERGAARPPRPRLRSRRGCRGWAVCRTRATVAECSRSSPSWTVRALIATS